MCAQVAHAAVDLYSQLNDQRSKDLNCWRRYGQTKIVVRGKSAEELLEIQNQASRTKGIVTATIQDAGRTEIETSSITCLGLFGTNSNLDPITGHLKLMHDCLRCSNNDSITKVNGDGRQRQTTKRARGKQKNDIKGEESPTEDSTVVVINSQSDTSDVQSTTTNTDGHVKQTETEIVEIK
ncbi:unnamed protein product [Didymodactylos carnosus]|uniref:peptidyl-tRNA hydrolase n=1 Tax=Didymodactylos carnosus TaxID=1234261 RepID=A0A813REX4_9BILA|nr:unnamed protein product [Didymodactylos carnosus]CAF0795166.1 unnamed protein product [Didymodactylos carnosus]CAF3564874.1 unnamed protein product [Didymodactylos carnosus]CAF3578122.1 unnamed protein product [Didymodactylos carnosus]